MMPPMASAPTRLRSRRLAALALAAGLALAGCESDDPGLDPGIGTGGAGQTSDTLGACPDGGPDATTPAAGCLGPDGRVLRP